MKLYTKKTLPKLKESQHYVILCEASTGVILNLEEKYNNNPDEFPILLFESFEEAKSFAEKKFGENSKIECSIYNYKNDFIQRV